MKRVVLSVFVMLALCLAGHVVAAGKKRAVFPNLELRALDGQSKVELASFRGRPVLLTFWATWCGPCRVELPELEKLYGELAGTGFTVLTVTVDDNPKVAERFLEINKIHLPVFQVDRLELRKLGISNVPTNVLLDREGRPIKLYPGYFESMPGEIHEIIRTMSEESGSEGPEQ